MGGAEGKRTWKSVERCENAKESSRGLLGPHDDRFLPKFQWIEVFHSNVIGLRDA
jgi:hypothetical protein